jgi:hypothetical protein
MWRLMISSGGLKSKGFGECGWDYAAVSLRTWGAAVLRPDGGGQRHGMPQMELK